MYLLLVVLLFQTTQASDKIKLYFSFITAVTGDSTSNGGIPIIDYAIEEINNNSNILTNYSLHYTEILDSKVKSRKKHNRSIIIVKILILIIIIL